MKKIVSTLLVIMLFLSVTAPNGFASLKTTAHKGTFYVKEKSIKVYKSPKTSTKIVTSVKKGAKLKSTKKTKIKKVTWYYIVVGKKKGWIQASKVTTKKPAKKKTDLEKLNQVGKKYGVKINYRKYEYAKSYSLFLNGNEEGYVEVRSKTTTLDNMYFYKGKHIMVGKKLTNMAIDSAIVLGFPISKKELTALAKKAQSHPHTAYKVKDGKIRVYADRGKTIYLDFYEDEQPEY